MSGSKKPGGGGGAAKPKSGAKAGAKAGGKVGEKGGAKAGGKGRAGAKKGAAPRSFGRRVLKWSLWLGFVGLLLGAGALVGGYWYFARGLPDFERIEDWRPPQTSRIRAADGTVIAEVFTERRTVVPLAAVPPVLKHAVISAEDAEFFQHEGLDYEGMLRALYNSVRAGRITGSGSTITQQVVKNLVLSPEQSFERKARELILARRLEQRVSKDGILSIYLNLIYLGQGRYGVAEAARHYFGHTDLDDITLAQAAWLAGLIPAPGRFARRKNAKQAEERQRYVLRMMEKNGYISAAERAAAEKADLGFVEPWRAPDEAQWFADVVRAELSARVGEEALASGGYDVRTTLDMGRQRAAVAALREGLRALDARQGFGKARETVPAEKAAAWRAKRAKALKDKPPVAGVAVPARVTAVEDDDLVVELGVGEALVDRDAVERFADPENRKASPYGVGDVIPVAVRQDGPAHPERMRAVPAGAPQGALVVLDPQSRHVLALVGGWSHSAYPFNRATQARRQPGSTFKPFVYGAALEAKRYTAASTVVDAPETLRVDAGKVWQPKNYDGRFKGVLSLRQALAKSVNSVAVSVTTDIGVPAVADFARRAGIASPLADGPAMALGASEVLPLELANAFATFAAGGRFAAPVFIVAIEGPAGAVAVEAPAAEQVIDPAVAWVLVDMMRSVVTSGSGARLKDFPRAVVGKTGTSNDARDTWFVGLLPEVVATAYVGFDQPRSLGKKEVGGVTALPVVKAYLEAAETKGPEWPAAPDGVEARRVVADGRLAPAGSEEGVVEYFLAGTAPSEVAPAAGEVDAESFLREQLGEAPASALGGPGLGGPALAVPSVDVQPLPPTLRPIAPASAEPAGEDDGPRLRPIAPAGADEGDEEDLPE
ncbi:MAG: PBP1A family penicillin-binding protein [Myxococcales bacterium]|nr:PBP1A family penicillin-binding protein [Myxococcales bacterium]